MGYILGLHKAGLIEIALDNMPGAGKYFILHRLDCNSFNLNKGVLFY